MLIESRTSLILAAILIATGTFKTVDSRRFAEASGREASTVGVITYVSGGRRASSYRFKFAIDGHEQMGVNAECYTPLSYKPCAVGEPVMVYYDTAHRVEATLQEYNDRAKGKLFFGVSLILGGLLLGVLHLIFRRMMKDSDGDNEADELEGIGDTPVHVTPET